MPIGIMFLQGEEFVEIYVGLLRGRAVVTFDVLRKKMGMSAV